MDGAQITINLDDAAVWIPLALIVFGVLWKTFVWLSNAYQWVREIHTELTPNEGKSLSDIIHRVDENDFVHHRNMERVYAMVLKMHDLDGDAFEVPLLETPVSVRAKPEVDPE